MFFLVSIHVPSPLGRLSIVKVGVQYVFIVQWNLLSQKIKGNVIPHYMTPLIHFLLVLVFLQHCNDFDVTSLFIHVKSLPLTHLWSSWRQTADLNGSWMNSLNQKIWSKLFLRQFILGQNSESVKCDHSCQQRSDVINDVRLLTVTPDCSCLSIPIQISQAKPILLVHTSSPLLTVLSRLHHKIFCEPNV